MFGRVKVGFLLARRAVGSLMASVCLCRLGAVMLHPLYLQCDVVVKLLLDRLVLWLCVTTFGVHLDLPSSAAALGGIVGVSWV